MADVLIVDDEAGMRRLVRRVVEREGVTVGEAESAEQAILFAARIPPKVAFCDVELQQGRRDGFWLANELNRLCPATVVVMMTSKDQVDAVVAGVRAGSHVYLAKPVAPEGLREALKAGLEEHATRVRNGAATPAAPLAASYLKPPPFRVVQLWGPDKGQQSTVMSEHATAADAFTEIGRLSDEMVRAGAPSDAVELVVIDDEGHVVRRPGTN
jgi:DNA-binding response OmpR family regulator